MAGGLRGGAAEYPVADAEQGNSWVYAARDRSGRYRAAAIASSKKGGSLKIMPIAAADAEAFRALVVDLPVHLAGKGRKAYIHHTPTAGEVAARQESSLEAREPAPGVLP